ncbi:hypothetical protein ACLEQD_43970, partial [Corallococcus sp. 4LFB]
GQPAARYLVSGEARWRLLEGGLYAVGQGGTLLFPRRTAAEAGCRRGRGAGGGPCSLSGGCAAGLAWRWWWRC